MKRKSLFTFVMAVSYAAMLLFSGCSSQLSPGPSSEGSDTEAVEKPQEAPKENASNTATEAPTKEAAPASGGKVIVGGKEFTEQLVMEQIIYQYLKANSNYDVQLNESQYATAAFATQALTDSAIDVYCEYTGTGFFNLLKLQLEPGDTPDSVYKKTKEGYEKELGLTWLEPFGFENTFTILLKQDKADELGIKSFSDLAKVSKELVLGIDSTFYDRQDGYQGLQKLYGFEFKDIKQMQISLAFQAMSHDEIEVLVAYSTDGRIPANNLKALEDDQHYFPPYFCAPVMRLDYAQKHPDLVALINTLAGTLDNVTMSKLNAEVDVNMREASDVAHEYLLTQGLIKE